jgi:hypothetical protein
MSQPDISREVLERELYVINQRLQGLFIDGAFIHRSYNNGAHTCLAGRGSKARQTNIGFAEREIQVNSFAVRSVICVGPAFDFTRLSDSALFESQQLELLAGAANALLNPLRKSLSLPAEEFARLRQMLAPYVEAVPHTEYEAVSIPTACSAIEAQAVYRTLGWSYEDWVKPNSPISPTQRRLIESDAIERHPIRIVGPGGSGKTLLMQLLALRRLRVARSHGVETRILYIVHNAAMATTVNQRFSVLLGGDGELHGTSSISVYTLAEYGQTELQLETTAVINADAHEAKQFQLDVLSGALHDAISASPRIETESNLFRDVVQVPELFIVLTKLVMAEISTAIKGHGLGGDKRRYVQSEKRLSRLHGALSEREREVVFDAYRRYHKIVFEDYNVLDSDDIALSLLGRLRTPIWDLKRRSLGFDYVFVDDCTLGHRAYS